METTMVYWGYIGDILGSSTFSYDGHTTVVKFTAADTGNAACNQYSSTTTANRLIQPDANTGFLDNRESW